MTLRQITKLIAIYNDPIVDDRKYFYAINAIDAIDSILKQYYKQESEVMREQLATRLAHRLSDSRNKRSGINSRPILTNNVVDVGRMK
jgi:hypothetical protein